MTPFFLLLFYNAVVKSWDVIIVGAGIIGLSLAISLRKQGMSVLVVERGEPGREASHAAAGMLVGSGAESPAALGDLAAESARLYPEFVHELEDESGMKVDLRDQGTILISSDGASSLLAREFGEPLSADQFQSLEPVLAAQGRGLPELHELGFSAEYLSERSVDPRKLTGAAIKSTRHRGVDISSGNEVKSLLVSAARVTGVETEKTSYLAGTVVNCAGAWAGCIAPHRFPVRPVKGQMLAVVGGPVLKHVIRSEKVYLVPRSDGRVLIGSTLEDVGYDKQTDASTIQGLFHAALELVPGLAESKVHEDWAGLRPGTADGLPILGETSITGYFVATGHYRDGILLAPITAQVMADLILGKPVSHDTKPFSPARFD
jgi:glycine oxidase